MFSIALPIELRRLASPAGFEPAADGFDVIRAFTTPQNQEMYLPSLSIHTESAHTHSTTPLTRVLFAESRGECREDQTATVLSSLLPRALTGQVE